MALPESIGLRHREAADPLKERIDIRSVIADRILSRFRVGNLPDSVVNKFNGIIVSHHVGQVLISNVHTADKVLANIPDVAVDDPLLLEVVLFGNDRITRFSLLANSFDDLTGKGAKLIEQLGFADIRHDIEMAPR